MRSQDNVVVATSSIEPIWFRMPRADSGRGSSLDDMFATLSELVDAYHAATTPGDETARIDADHHLAGRTEALKRAALIGGNAAAADLELLVRDSLLPFQFGEAHGISLHGPTVLLRPAPALLLVLVLHELVTNAIKFGALGGTSRQHALEIAWEHRSHGVHFTWRETGVAILTLGGQPRSGFGRKMIESTLPALSGAQARFDLRPGGVDCTFFLPNTALLY